MYLIVLGVVAIISIVGYLIYKKFERKKKSFSSPSCSGCGISGHNLRKVTAKNASNYGGSYYEMKFYFKCDKCGSEESVSKSCNVEYKIRNHVEINIRNDVCDAVREIAKKEWGIDCWYIPNSKIEVET